MLSKGKARRLTQKILSYTMAPEVTVSVSETVEGNSRFANGSPTTNGQVERLSISVTATIDGRSATVRGNADDDASLKRLVRDAEETAVLAPVDPEHVALLGKQTYVRVKARDAGTAKLGPTGRPGLIEPSIAVGKDRGTAASGLLRHGETATARANSAGLFAYHAATQASLSTTHRTPDGTGSGRAAWQGHAIGTLDARKLAERAAEKAEMSRGPEAADPGKWTVVLEPQAVSDLLGFLLRGLSQRSADEGRSYFSTSGGGTRVGERIFHESITLSSDPAHALHPANPVAGDGQPQRPVTWIDKGVLKSLSCSRYWAQKIGRDPLPRPSSLHLAGTRASVADLVAGVDKGILVTRFWYNRMLEPRTLLATGLTRDGTFRIEKGKIVGAVKNFRYNDSPLTLLKRALALGEPERVETRGSRVVVVPPMVVEGFNFSSTSDAV